MDSIKWSKKKMSLPIVIKKKGGFTFLMDIVSFFFMPVADITLSINLALQLRGDNLPVGEGGGVRS